LQYLLRMFVSSVCTNCLDYILELVEFSFSLSLSLSLDSKKLTDALHKFPLLFWLFVLFLAVFIFNLLVNELQRRHNPQFQNAVHQVF